MLEGAGRPGRRVHAVELPDQSRWCHQALSRSHGLLDDHRQGGRRNARSPAELIRAFVDAGLPGVISLVYGDPAEIKTT